MLDWSQIDFTPLANSVLALITAAIVAVAVTLGRRSKPEAKPAAVVEMAGAAIVSSETVVLLTREIAANNVNLAQMHADQRDYRKVQYQTVEHLARCLDEVGDLRQSIQNLTLEMARRGR